MKRIPIIIMMLCTLCTLSFAQIQTNWTADMPSSKIPTGVTLNDIDTLDNPTVIKFEIDLDATTYDNANKVTAFNALGAGLKTEIDSNWIEDVWAMDPTLDIVGAIIIDSVNRVWDTFEHPDHIEQYIVAEDVYRIRGRFKYIITPP